MPTPLSQASRRTHPQGGERRGLVARLARRLVRRPERAAGLVVAMAAFGWILTNAALLQNGPHPAPLFAGTADPLRDAAVTATLVRPTGDAALDQRPADPIAAMTQDPLAGMIEQASPLVQTIQQGLAERGYYHGRIDGKLQPQTVDAIRAFEAAHGLQVDGKPTLELMATLASGEASSPSRLLVGQVQSALAERGFGPITVDGIMGQETSGAITRFEQAQGLAPSGEITPALLRALSILPAAES